MIMRLMKLGWMGAVTLSSLLALEPLAQAQEKKDEKPAAPPAPVAPAVPAVRPVPTLPPGGLATGPEIRARRAEAQLKSMTQRLALTEDQQTKIKPILEEQFKGYED